ncbi:MAG TPA: DUF2252 family protein, partial [Vicinamibacterales bacterium]
MVAQGFRLGSGAGALRQVLAGAKIGCINLALRAIVVAVIGVALAVLAAPEGGAIRLQRGQVTEPASEWLGDQNPSSLPRVLVETIRQDPYSFFRRVNRVWTERVCQAFGSEKMPSVRLHGDAHVEQYGLTATAQGLDDFDDSAEGPAVVDLVRFIGSLDLAAARRGWRANRAIDQFLDGYQRGLQDPSYSPRAPGVVQRLRAKPVQTPAAFLASSEGRMEAVPPEVEPQARKALELVAAAATTMPPGYFALKRIGALQMGVGSYTTPKFLMRVEGPSAAPDDDVILEAKEVSDLGGVTCITTPDDGKAVRVITGSRQIGRLRHQVLSVIPDLRSDAPPRREYWLRSWDRTYAEVRIPDLRSNRDLEELAHDAGAQL